MQRAIAAGGGLLLAGGIAVFGVWPRVQPAPPASPERADRPPGAALLAPRSTPSPTAAPHAISKARTTRRPPASAKVKPIHSLASTGTSAKYLVLIVLDGARPDYFTVPGIPHVRALMRNGTTYSNASAGILESETPSGHASISTGSVPKENGLPGFDWVTSDNIPVNLFDPAKIRDGSMERVLSNAHAPSIAGLLRKHSPKATIVAMSGHKYYAADALGGPDANVIMYYTGTPDGRFVPEYVPGHAPPAGLLADPALSNKSSHLPLAVEDHLAMKLAIASVKRMHEQALLLNVPEFDWPLGHVDGGNRDPAAVRTLMQGFDQDLAALENEYRQAGVLDKTLFVLTADHGMSPIYHTVPQSSIDSAVTDTGAKIIQSSYHTADYVWIDDKTKAPQAALNIAHQRNPLIQAVYFKEPVPGGYEFVRASGIEQFAVPGMEQANQALLSTFDGPTAPDLAVLYTEGAATLPGGQATWKGDHGGASWEAQHVPLVLSGPGVRRGHVSDSPARIRDIAPTALSLLGVAPIGMGGVPLADALLRPTAAERRAQGSVNRALGPIVQALRAESRAEITAGL